MTCTLSMLHAPEYASADSCRLAPFDRLLNVRGLADAELSRCDLPRSSPLSLLRTWLAPVKRLCFACSLPASVLHTPSHRFRLLPPPMSARHNARARTKRDDELVSNCEFPVSLPSRSIIADALLPGRHPSFVPFPAPVALKIAFLTCFIQSGETPSTMAKSIKPRRRLCASSTRFGARA